MRELELCWMGFEYSSAFCQELNPVEHIGSTINIGVRPIGPRQTSKDCTAEVTRNWSDI